MQFRLKKKLLLFFLNNEVSVNLMICHLKGFLIEFIAAPVIAGFTTAAALTIGTTQISSLLGLKFQAVGFVQTWQAVFEHIQETQTWDAVMGFSSVAILLALRVRGTLDCTSTQFSLGLCNFN